MAEEQKIEDAKPDAAPAVDADWLADANYTGPLTGEQAQARIARHGHWRAPETKPAKAGQDKGAK